MLVLYTIHELLGMQFKPIGRFFGLLLRDGNSVSSPTIFHVHVYMVGACVNHDKLTFCRARS